MVKYLILYALWTPSDKTNIKHNTIFVYLFVFMNIIFKNVRSFTLKQNFFGEGILVK